MMWLIRNVDQKYFRNNSLSTERLEDLVGKLHAMLLYIGRLTDLPSHVTLTTACHHGNKASIGVCLITAMMRKP